MRKPKKNPCGKVYKIKDEQRVKLVLSDEQVGRSSGVAAGMSGIEPLWRILVAGMRISELVGLDVGDIDIVGSAASLRQGRKERPAFFTHARLYIWGSIPGWRRALPDTSAALS